MSRKLEIEIEKAVVRVLVEEQAKAGFVPVCFFNGDEYQTAGGKPLPLDEERWNIYAVKAPKDPSVPMTAEEVIEALFAVDEGTIHFAPKDNLAEWGSKGVFIILGNGPADELFSDWHCGNKQFDKAVLAAIERVSNASNLVVSFK
jgi:hypothetical protein